MLAVASSERGVLMQLVSDVQQQQCNRRTRPTHSLQQYHDAARSAMSGRSACQRKVCLTCDSLVVWTNAIRGVSTKIDFVVAVASHLTVVPTPDLLYRRACNDHMTA